MEKPDSILAFDEIVAVWGCSDFGKDSKRDIVDMALLKVACGYSNGHTAECIIKELGLVTDKLKLTRLGREYLYSSFQKIKNF